MHENRRKEYRTSLKDVNENTHTYTVKRYTYFQSRPKERLGEVCVLRHGRAIEIDLQDGSVLRNVIILT